MDRDSNVLFGVLANRLHPSQWSTVKRVLREWQADPAVEMPERLVKAGVLSERDRQGIAEMVRLLVEDHGGDDGAALAALGGMSGLQTAPSAACLEGQTLAAALAACKTPEDRLGLLPQFISLCDVVGAAHGRGVIHRALTPEGVLLTPYGETLVTDWSLSKLRGHHDHHRERLGKLAADKGMKPYLAPEFLQGGVDEVDTRTDVYALGAILYEMLTGEAPENGKAPEGAGPLYQICRRAMFKEPSARYATASQVADALEQAVEGAQAEEELAVIQGVSPIYKRLFGLTAALLVAFAFSSLYLYQALTAEQMRAAAVFANESKERKAMEEARDELAEQLKQSQQARARVEAERNTAEEDAARFRAEAERAQEQLRIARQQEAAPRPAEQPAPKPPRLAPTDEQGTPESPIHIEPFSTPLPDIMPQVEEVAEPPVPAVPAVPETVPAEPVPPAAGQPAPPAPPTPETSDVLAAMPTLMASVLDQKVEGVESAAMVRITEATPEAIREMGFRDGDIITRINRVPVQNAAQAREALAAVQNDAGFSIRIMREGRAGWMRINFNRPAPPQAAPEQAAPEAAPAPAPEAPQP